MWKRIVSAVLVILAAGSPVLCQAGRMNPEDLEYAGAIRMPLDEAWEYSGYAMTYYPDGDPSGEDDGYPGSLFVLGHDHHQLVGEISIPEPVISGTKNPGDLRTATVLQEPADITGGMFAGLEIPRAGIEYLPSIKPGGPGKIHFCWGQHFQENEPSHGWSRTDLSKPNPKGPWLFGGYTNYVTNDYLFEIPEDWASEHVPGHRLACGRFRDGHWGGRGPALFAYDPDTESPPGPGGVLEGITPLFLYGSQEPGAIEITGSTETQMKGFAEADEWSGGAWLGSGDEGAVILVGTKALGKNWYGFSNGVVWPTDGSEDAVYPEVPEWPYDDRGWWSEDISAQMIFFDPGELAQAASGKIHSHEPQPYAVLAIDDVLFDPGLNVQNSKRYLVGAAAYDRARGILYVVERRADEGHSLIHVWRVRS